MQTIDTYVQRQKGIVRDDFNVPLMKTLKLL